MPKPKKKCDRCGKVFNTKVLKKKNGNIYCHNCYLTQSKCLLPNVPKKVPKSYLPPKRKKVIKKKDVLPKIKPIKKKVTSNKYFLFIRKEEKLILYKKFISEGIQSPEANKRVKMISEKMNELARKLRNEAKEKDMTKEQIQLRFIEGLERYTREEMESGN